MLRLNFSHNNQTATTTAEYYMAQMPIHLPHHAFRYVTRMLTTTARAHTVQVPDSLPKTCPMLDFATI